MNIQTKIDDTKGEAAYDRDFALWALEQARLLGEGRFAELDIVNLLDEVESLGRSQKTELRNRLAILVEHLLKHRHGRLPYPRNGWHETIREQRRMIGFQFDDSPSLRTVSVTLFEQAWPTGVYAALKSFETYEPSLIKTYRRELSETPDFSLEQALDEDFLPVPEDE